MCARMSATYCFIINEVTYVLIITRMSSQLRYLEEGDAKLYSDYHDLPTYKEVIRLAISCLGLK